MMWRAIDTLNGNSGKYRCYTVVTDGKDGKFESAYVTAYADIPDSCKLEMFGEDYHDSDEVFIWGSYNTSIKSMGWENAEKMVSELKKRFNTTRQFIIV